MWNCESALFIQSALLRVRHLLILKPMMKMLLSNVYTSIMSFNRGRRSGKKTCLTSNSKKTTLSIPIGSLPRVKIPSTIIILREETLQLKEKLQSSEQTGCTKSGGWERIRFLWRDVNFKLKKTKWRNWHFPTINSSHPNHLANIISCTQPQINLLTLHKGMRIAKELMNYIAQLLGKTRSKKLWGKKYIKNKVIHSNLTLAIHPWGPAQ